jgi:YidC/Oxa1 family membrane protein insertase
MPEQQQPNRGNPLLFILLAILIYLSWTQFFRPPPPPKPADSEATAKKEKAAADVVIPPPPKVVPDDELRKRGLVLGSEDRGSDFHLGVLFDPRGAGVRRIVLNRFQAADDRGLPVWKDKEQKIPAPLELVSSTLNAPSASFLLFHYAAARDLTDDKPLDTLGVTEWRPDRVEETTLDDGRRQQRLAFHAEAGGMEVTKTYTLTEKDYHLGLEVRLRRAPGGKTEAFRYQLTGAHGLPVEGKWYTNTFRNAMVTQAGGGSVERDLQDLRQISVWGGGREVRREPGKPLAWYGVAVQFFASVVAVDDRQEKRDFLDHARPTLEAAVVKGTVLSVNPAASTFALKPSEERDEPITFHVLPGNWDAGKFSGLQEGSRVAVVYHAASYNARAGVYPRIADRVENEETTHALWENDITVRASTEPIEVKAGQEVVQRFVLYNGPVKVSQLYDGEAVPPAVVDRYIDALHLNVLTDYQSPGVIGSFSHTICMTWVVIKFTNLMHLVLGLIHKVVPSYGLCIILLTVLVRGLMYPVSRKQQLMSFKMQKLMPELKKLQEKHKDDRQALGLAQMELYRRHGVNPLGSCWFLLLQMPIFVGLYVALQESIHFRLAEFWPTWIRNLAAPDMMIPWGENIPWISRVQDFGGFLYLGPFFNLLPVIAVALMIWQQKILSPPPADEQQAMQMKVMRWMMIVMGLFFYKVAAGLCIYFIASSAWSYAERKLLLPKFAPDVDRPSSESLFQRLLARAQGAQPATAPAAAVRPASSAAVTPDRGRKERRARRRPERGRPEDETNGAGTGLLERLRRWWHRVLEDARKK